MSRRLLQRVVWNTANWRRPTATSNEAGYPEDNGFGHEEWNFQTDDAVDGDVLGYIYWTPGAKALRESGGVFDIGFWAIHPKTRRRLLVGRYAKARVADDEFREHVIEEFDDRGIFRRRAEELRAVVQGISSAQAMAKVREGIEDGWMRFRCPVEAVTALEPTQYVEVPERIQDAGLSLRFAAPTFVGAFPVQNPGGGDEYGRTSPLAEDAYFREVGARLHTIVPLHNALSNAFAAWAKHRGFSKVRQEAFRVDVEFHGNSGLHRAELKTCHGVGTTKSIREALGQLLEYNHYGLRSTAATWWVVLDTKPSNDDRKFIKVLREKRGLPLVLCWEVDDGFETDISIG
jgi:hypothetical protein